MKTIIIILAALVSFNISFAQEKPDSVQTLVGEGGKITFFTGPFLRNKWFKNSSAVSAFGGGAGVYYNHTYYVYLQTTSFPIERGSNSNDKYILNALGVSVGYCFNHSRVLHFVAGSQIYYGAVTNNKDVNPDNNIKLNYLMLAPELYLEVNLLSYVRLYAGPSYYITIGNGSHDWVNAEFVNGFSFNFGLLVGKF